MGLIKETRGFAPDTHPTPVAQQEQRGHLALLAFQGLGEGFCFGLPVNTLAEIIHKFDSLKADAAKIPPDSLNLQSEKFLQSHGVWNPTLGLGIAELGEYEGTRLVSELLSEKGEPHMTIGFLWAIIQASKKHGLSKKIIEANKSLFVKEAEAAVLKQERALPKAKKGLWTNAYSALEENSGGFFDYFINNPSTDHFKA